ncbi:NADPH-dependent F420 reductase [Citrobacter koseri]|uniref:NADPH-dependent F420 reductase n=1 Tax=Citrobacter koseri TaxID=545 RepID=UPI0023B028AA|nr:NADPH-dependent F420 reductase [Citrobacter koseri]
MNPSRRTVLKSLGIIAAMPWLIANPAFAAAPMRIGVIGAGWLGGTVGRLWIKAGHEVMFSSRHPERLASLVGESGPRASVGRPAEAAAFGSVLLLSVPFEALPQVGRELHQFYTGKVVLDATNPPLSGGDSPLIQQARSHGVAQTVAKYMPDARLVRAFSCVDAGVVETSAARRDGRIGMPIASDDAGALAIAESLVRDAGCDPVVVGNLASAVVFQQGGPGWRAHLPAPELRRRLGLPAGG